MAAPSGLTRFAASLRVGPLPAPWDGRPIYFGVSVTVAFLMTTSVTGRSPGFVFVLPIFWTTASDSASAHLPKAVYWLSRKKASALQMKNCVPAEFGSLERAIDRTPAL